MNVADLRIGRKRLDLPQVAAMNTWCAPDLGRKPAEYLAILDLVAIVHFHMSLCDSRRNDSANRGLVLNSHHDSAIRFFRCC